MYPNSNSKFSPMRPPSPTTFVNFSPPTDYPISSSSGGGIATSSIVKNPNTISLPLNGPIVTTNKSKSIHHSNQKTLTSNMVGIHNYPPNSDHHLHQQHLQQLQQQQQLHHQQQQYHLNATVPSLTTEALNHSMPSSKQNNHLTKNKINHNNNINTTMTTGGGNNSTGGNIGTNNAGFIDSRMVQSATMGGRFSNDDFFYNDDIDSIEFCRATTDNLILNSNDDCNSANFINSTTAATINGAANSCPGSSFTERRRRGHSSRRSNHKLEVEQQVKWTRKNIAATMERFEPTPQKLDYGATSTTPPLQSSQSVQLQLQNTPNYEHNNPVNHVYSYAYYEPGAAKCHTNIPPKDFNPQPLVGSSVNQISTTSIASTSSSSSSVGLGGSIGSSNTSPFAVNMGASTSSGIRNSNPGPSKSPPRNSIRALLAKSFRSKTLNSNKSFDTNHHNSHHSQSPIHNTDDRHNYTTRYGTTENLYEEVNDQKIRKVLSDNRIVSINSPTVKEELRRVQHNHFRVLDELNLSLEALIMPQTPPDISPTVEEKVSHASSMENLSSTLNSIELKDHTCINPEFDEGDLDSGFSGSGSSSGASYNESLRYYKTTGGNNVIQTTTLPHNIRSCRNSTASGTSTSKSSMNSDDHGIGLTMSNGANSSIINVGASSSSSSSSPFNFIRRCSDSQRSSGSVIAVGGACSNNNSSNIISGTKGKKSFWTIKQ